MMTKKPDIQIVVIVVTVTLILSSLANIVQIRSFSIDYDNNQFLKDGQPFRYISGSIHYFRVPKVHWQDRLDKMWGAGLNAIQVYVDWALHEPEPLEYNFEDNLNIVEFLTLANKTGFMVILRPGPYIDSEVDFGGFPYWLLRENPYMVLRTNDPTYLKFVDSWMAKLFSLIRPLLYENGGPIITVQVENEYGSCNTCNYKYKIHLRDLFRKYLGNNVTLFTTDGSSRSLLNCGTIDGVYPTVDFGLGTNVDDAFKLQREFAPKGPLVNSEFYTGWLDHWGEPHSRVNIYSIRQTLDYMLSKNASVNMYMFHGGTSFGFNSGANMDLLYEACPTSYDYGGPLSEAGDPTDLLFAIKQVISKYKRVPWTPVPPPTKKAAYGYVSLQRLGGIFDMLKYLVPNQPVMALDPATFEELGQAYGFLLYETSLSRLTISTISTLQISGIRDRAYIFRNRYPVGILSRTDKTDSITIENYGSDTLSILVENQGRISVGSAMKDFKGIIYNVTYEGRLLKNWKMSSIPLNNTQNLNMSCKSSNNNNLDDHFVPSFYCGEFVLSNETAEPQDTFLDTTGWTKGVAFINGFNLGRYWPVKGPQITLFVPKSVLLPYPKKNKIILFEQEGAPSPNLSVQFLDYAIIDSLLGSSTRTVHQKYAPIPAPKNRKVAFH